MKNPTLEEFSSQRFNSIRKAITTYYDLMIKRYSDEDFDSSDVEKTKGVHLKELDETINTYLRDFAAHKELLEYVLDYYYVLCFSRIAEAVFVKYPVEDLSEDYDDELNYDSVFAFVAYHKHWLSPAAKITKTILEKRKVSADNLKRSSFFTKFTSHSAKELNTLEKPRHFLSIAALPEYNKLPRTMGADGRTRDVAIQGFTPFGKLKYGSIEFKFAENTSALLEFWSKLQSVENEINSLLSDVAIPPSTEIVMNDEESFTPAQMKYLLRKADDFIIFEDGSKWVNLNRTACDLEKNSLGHCGNFYRADETNLIIFSFRTPTEEPNKFIGRLTFIYNTKTRLIGESKARNNNKPESRYHPYIVQLLLNDMVDGLEQGKHAKQLDFSFYDLSDEWLEKLIIEKPTLFTKSKVGRGVIIARGKEELWTKSFEKVTGQKAPSLDTLKFDE